MNFKLFPSLKDRALTKVAIAIWNKDILMAINGGIRLASSNIYFRFDLERAEIWNDLERAEVKVREKAQELLLPTNLNKNLLNVIKVMRLELCTWVQYHIRFGNFLGADTLADSKFLFHWTSYGTIDRERTAKAIIEDENVSTFTRYKYACAYCLEPSIRNLWGRLDSSSKQAIKCYSLEEIGNVFDLHFPLADTIKNRALIFWSFTMYGETIGPDADIMRLLRPEVFDESLYWYPFEGAVFEGNDIALKYLMPKLTCEERERFLIKAAGYLTIFSQIKMSKVKRSYKIYYSNALCFLLSSMTEIQQTEFFSEHAHDVLVSFLEWPWQQYFVSTAEQMWKYLSPIDFKFLLHQLLNPDYLRVYTDFNYEDIFQKFWEQSLHTHRKFILEGTVHNILLLSYVAGQKRNILLIMSYATREQCVKILRCSKKLCLRLIISDNLNFLKLLLQKCIPPGDESKIIELNAGFASYIEADLATKESEMTKLTTFVSDFVVSLEKRKLEEEDKVPLKKTCTENNRG